MEFFSSITSFGGSTLSYIIPFLFVLSVVVFFHEFGHFIVARWFGVKVDAFSLGFGPELWGRYDKHGTRWKLSAIPLGGYVKFLGDEMVASKPDSLKNLETYDEATRKQLFQLKPVWQRALVVFAGPLANFILAIVIFSGLFMTVGKAIVEPRVGAVVQGSAAQDAGFAAGDIILNIDGHNITSFSDVQRLVALSYGQPLHVTVKRNEAPLDLTVTPKMQAADEKNGGEAHWMIGLQSPANGNAVRFEKYNPLQAVAMATQETVFITERTLIFIKDLFAGRAPVKELGGPIRIAQVSGEAADVSYLALLSLTAILSISIGLLNLFPIPMLDGGHLVFYAIEAIRRRPLSENVQEIGFKIGLALVLMLMVLATWNDVTRLIKL
ncbi:MAG: RIP metalloprotease RseP [Pseudomonadota bacterium]